MKKIPIRQISSAPTEQALAERFSIRKIEDVLGGKDLLHDLHRHDFFFMLALQKGTGTHEIDFIKYEIIDNAVFLLRPGQVHQLKLKAGSTGYLVEFNAEFYHPNNKASAQRLQKASVKTFCQLEVNRFTKLQAALTYMFQEHTTRQEGSEDVIKANLDIFFIELVRQSRNPAGTPANTTSYTQERFEEFLHLLETHITTYKEVSQYTHLMNLSPYQLNEITKATIGRTSSALINEHIVLEAKRYLLATPNQIKEIADHLGYEDVSYFTRFFKKQTGNTPEAFRHNFR